MKKVKIYGAGSVGNHLSHASRQMGWEVDLCDIDPDALIRTKYDIYPSRYGKWDEAIGLYPCNEVPKKQYDLHVIGTPPDSHMALARSAVVEGARAVLVEKPLCTPDLEGAHELFEEASAAGCSVFVGYDHVVSKSAALMSKMIADETVGPIQTLDVEFREHWGGIFNAHPWLSGPSNTYLGFWRKGGGATGEHSHAINLWQHFSNESRSGRIIEVNANMQFVKDDNVDYDAVSLMQLRTEKGMIGRVVQDVITQPTRKWARAQCEKGYIEWYCGLKAGMDTVAYGYDNGDVTTHDMVKTRPDDFLQEMKHINAAMESRTLISPICLERGLESMLVIAAAYMSARECRPVRIDYGKGYTIDALSLVK
jgi:predicted dehydrogenase